MILRFYEDLTHNVLLCDLLEGSGRLGEPTNLLSTYEMTEELKEIISQVLWLDDLPISVPLDKFEAFLSAVGYSRKSLISSHVFWNEIFERAGDELPVSAFIKTPRNPIKF